MNPLDHFNSIDSQLARMRQHFEEERKTLQDQLFIAQAEARLAHDQLEKAVEARAGAERVTAKLLTQFSTVAMIFEEAKRLAITAGLGQEAPPPATSKALEAALIPNPFDPQKIAAPPNREQSDLDRINDALQEVVRSPS